MQVLYLTQHRQLGHVAIRVFLIIEIINYVGFLCLSLV